MLAEANILGRLTGLARQIRKPQEWVGYSAFILFGLAKKFRPYMWEGGQRIDLMDTFAPWAKEECIHKCMVDGVVCCMGHAKAGFAEMLPVSEGHPLWECRHFLSCVGLPRAFESGGSSMQAYYNRLGQVILGTVADGDCGLDVMSQMMGVTQSSDERVALREVISDYLLERLEAPWMHDLMVACHELDKEDVLLFRSGGHRGSFDDPIPVDAAPPADRVGAGGDAVRFCAEWHKILFPKEDEASEEEDGHADAVEDGAPAVAEGHGLAAAEGQERADAVMGAPAVAEGHGHADAECQERILKALKWATKVTDKGLLTSIAGSLPDWTIKEQLRLYDARLDKPAKPAVAGDAQIKVQPLLLSSRDEVAAAYDKFLRADTGDIPKRAAFGKVKEFLKTRTVWTGPMAKKTLKYQRDRVRTWWESWKKDGAAEVDRREGEDGCQEVWPEKAAERGPGETEQVPHRAPASL